jgi:hypothetical protein
MDDSQPQKRRRPITICTECHRRKQKCDRQKPCGGCVARNVDKKCVYPTLSEHDNGSVPEPTRTESATTSVNLADSLGYSTHNKIKGTLDDLQLENANPQVSSRGDRDYGNETEPVSYESLVARVPCEAIITDIARIYFSETDWYFCALDEPYFNELYQLWKSQKPTRNSKITITPSECVLVRDAEEVRYFPAILFQLVALSLHFVPTSCVTRDLLKLKDHRAADRLSKYYSDTGLALTALLGRIDSPIAAVLADVLRCAWLKNSGSGSRSWHALSDAVRQAQNLGLHEHRDVPRNGPVDETIRALWYDEHRRRVWASIFMWDAYMALMLGRSRMINVDDCTVQTPMDCDIPLNPMQVIPSPAIVSGRPSTYTSQIFKYKVAFKIHEAMSLRALKSPCKDYSVVTRLHADVDKLVDELPDTVRQTNPDTSWDVQYPNLAKQRHQIALVASSFILAIHRPHATTRPESRKEAIAAALRGLTAQQCLFEYCSEHHYKIHTLTFYTIDMVIFLTSMVLMYCNPTASGDEVYDVTIHDIRYALLQAVNRMSLMRSRSDVAKEGDKVVRRCSDLVAKREREYRARFARPVPPPAVLQQQSNGSNGTGGYINFLTDFMPHSGGSTGITPSETDSSASDGAQKQSTASAGVQAYPDYHAPAMNTQMHVPGYVAGALKDGNLNSWPLEFDFEPLPEYLHSVDFASDKANTATWMEQNGFMDAALLLPPHGY